MQSESDSATWFHGPIMVKSFDERKVKNSRSQLSRNEQKLPAETCNVFLIGSLVLTQFETRLANGVEEARFRFKKQLGMNFAWSCIQHQEDTEGDRNV